MCSEKFSKDEHIQRKTKRHGQKNCLQLLLQCSNSECIVAFSLNIFGNTIGRIDVYKKLRYEEYEYH